MSGAEFSRRFGVGRDFTVSVFVAGRTAFPPRPCPCPSREPSLMCDEEKLPRSELNRGYAKRPDPWPEFFFANEMAGTPPIPPLSCTQIMGQRAASVSSATHLRISLENGLARPSLALLPPYPPSTPLLCRDHQLTDRGRTELLISSSTKQGEDWHKPPCRGQKTLAPAPRGPSLVTAFGPLLPSTCRNTIPRVLYVIFHVESLFRIITWMPLDDRHCASFIGKFLPRVSSVKWLVA